MMQAKPNTLWFDVSLSFSADATVDGVARALRHVYGEYLDDFGLVVSDARPSGVVTATYRSPQAAPTTTAAARGILDSELIPSLVAAMADAHGGVAPEVTGFVIYPRGSYLRIDGGTIDLAKCSSWTWRASRRIQNAGYLLRLPWIEARRWLWLRRQHGTEA